MLCLSRGKNQTIEIGDIGLLLRGKIRITVLDIRGDKVRLGVEAARDIPVHRGEIYELIHSVNASLSSSNEGSSNADHDQEHRPDDDGERQAGCDLDGTNGIGNPSENDGGPDAMSGSGPSEAV